MINNILMTAISTCSCACRVDTSWWEVTVTCGGFAPFETVTKADSCPNGQEAFASGINRIPNSPVYCMLTQEDTKQYTVVGNSDTLHFITFIFVAGSFCRCPGCAPMDLTCYSCMCKGKMEHN